MKGFLRIVQDFRARGIRPVRRMFRRSAGLVEVTKFAAFDGDRIPQKGREREMRRKISVVAAMALTIGVLSFVAPSTSHADVISSVVVNVNGVQWCSAGV